MTRVDYQTVNLGQLGYRLVKGDAQKYLTGEKQSWNESWSLPRAILTLWPP